MLHISRSVSSAADIASLFADRAMIRALEEARSVPVQVFSSNADPEWIVEVEKLIHRHAPDAVVMGACSGEQISNGSVLTGGTVVSISCFESAKLVPLAFDIAPGQEAEAADFLNRSLSSCTNLKGVLLLAPPLTIDAGALIHRLAEGNPDLILFGGGSGKGAGLPAPVFLNDVVLEHGVVAVALCGQDLHVKVRTLFDWRPLGPAVQLTEVEGGAIRKIDGRPAFDLYRENLDIQADEDLYLLEFPLLIERNGTLLARNPLAPEDDGSVRIVADACTGETARFGYLDMSALAESIHRAERDLRQFRPQGIYLYSCVCRHFTLQEEIELETCPFQDIAPSAGFFTYGEFCRLNGLPQVLNSSEVIVALREGPASPLPAVEAQSTILQDNPIRERHMRMTSHLFRFIGALTERIDAANKVLTNMADHDSLTGALNRRALDRHLPLEIERARRFNHRLSIIMFDLDLFKQFNDTCGHAAGDQILINVTALVQSRLRRLDRLYRFGGEEFVLLLPETDNQGAFQLAEELRTTIESGSIVWETRVLPSVTASFGVSTWPDDGGEMAELLHSADTYMYASKARGRNCITRGLDL